MMMCGKTLVLVSMVFSPIDGVVYRDQMGQTVSSGKAFLNLQRMMKDMDKDAHMLDDKCFDGRFNTSETCKQRIKRVKGVKNVVESIWVDRMRLKEENNELRSKLDHLLRIQSAGKPDFTNKRPQSAPYKRNPRVERFWNNKKVVVPEPPPGEFPVKAAKIEKMPSSERLRDFGFSTRTYPPKYRTSTQAYGGWYPKKSKYYFH